VLVNAPGDGGIDNVLVVASSDTMVELNIWLPLLLNQRRAAGGGAQGAEVTRAERSGRGEDHPTWPTQCLSP
jgi:hypothetical protein